MILEICVDNMEAAIAAEKAGANRIELCSNLSEGGVTPSTAYIEYAVQNLSIPVFPIIRPRAGDFYYSNAEYEIMMNDVLQCQKIGCKGVVLGILKKDGAIDTERVRELVDMAGQMEVTFHRAFDRTNDMEQALEDVIATGCKRILSSGLYPTVNEGVENLRQLVVQSNNRIIIMPGSGVRSTNLEKLISITKAVEYHSSAKKITESRMQFINSYFDTTENYYQGIDEEEVIKMKHLLID